MYDRILSDAEQHQTLKNKFVSSLQNEIAFIDQSCNKLENKTAETIHRDLTQVQALLEQKEFPIQKILTEMRQIRKKMKDSLTALSQEKAGEYKPAKEAVEKIEIVAEIKRTSEDVISWEKAAEKALKILNNRLESKEEKSKDTVKMDIVKINTLLNLATAYNSPLMNIKQLTSSATLTDANMTQYVTASQNSYSVSQIQAESKLDKSAKESLMDLLNTKFRESIKEVEAEIKQIQQKLERFILLNLGGDYDKDVVKTSKIIRNALEDRVQTPLTEIVEKNLKKSSVNAYNVKNKDALIKEFKGAVDGVKSALNDIKKLVTGLEVRVSPAAFESLAIGNELAMGSSPLAEFKQTKKKDKDEDPTPVIPSFH